MRAGINRFNVSIDSLQKDRFFELTRRDALPQVLRGLEALGEFPEAHPIKINAVAMRDFTEEEALPFAEFARRTPYEVRFIEFMPLDADHAWTADQVLTGAEIRDAIDAVYPLEPEPREPHATARVYRFADGHGKIGFINPVSEPFCGDCNRDPPDRRGQAADVPVLAQRDRPARRRCGTARATTSSSRSSATRSGARSSSTTSASRASCSPPARCPPSAVDTNFRNVSAGIIRGSKCCC